MWKVRKTLNLNIKPACKWAVAYIFIVTLPSAGHTSFMMKVNVLDNNGMLCLSEIILNMKYLVLRKYLYGDSVHLSNMYTSMINTLHICYMLTAVNLIFSWPQLRENFSCIAYQRVIKSFHFVVKLIPAFDIAVVRISACFCFFSWRVLGVGEHIPSKTSAEKILFHNKCLNVMEVRRLLDLCVYVYI